MKNGSSSVIHIIEEDFTTSMFTQEKYSNYFPRKKTLLAFTLASNSWS